MTQRVTFGESSGALALPDGSGRVPAVIVIQEWHGISKWIDSMVDRWAKEGYVALAPDLYHGKVVTTDAEAGAMATNLDKPKALGEIAAAVEYVKHHPRCNGKVVVTGYCLGGGFTFAAAASIKGLSAAVPFYGMMPGDWSKVEAPIQAHFCKTDEWASVASAKQVQDALAKHGKTMELHVYDAHHAFCRDTDPSKYDASSAKLAWQRATAFVKQHTA